MVDDDQDRHADTHCGNTFVVSAEFAGNQLRQLLRSMLSMPRLLTAILLNWAATFEF